MNQLAKEQSPYLLEHATNPVDWYPWGDIPFSKAKEMDIPVFLSIGYMACHWCHVMEKESFENIEIANILNENFVSIKVDREERPDIDKIYMDALMSMNGSGGWPLNMFLTPEGKPFYGGTYFPPEGRYGIYGIKEVLLSISRAWLEKKDDLVEHSNTVTNHLKQMVKFSEDHDLKISSEFVLNNYFDNFDDKFGGWGLQPKFPHSMALDLLIGLDSKLDGKSQNAVIKTLDTMALGGFHDILRGGFHRYSTDRIWLVPHFEKMLYDNALLAKTYLFAGKNYENIKFLNVSRSTLEFIKNEFLADNGGFFSSLDADSDGHEGLYYIWTHDELQNAFSDEEWQLIQNSIELPQGGNFEGQLILRMNDNGPVPQVLKKLKEIQKTRNRPFTDDKILTDWNALAISSFAVAGKFFSNQEYKKIASKCAEFILSKLFIDHRLYHSWRNGNARHKAFLSDYAFFINALYDLFSMESNIKWLDVAFNLTHDMVNLFSSENQFFDTASDQDNLIIRPITKEDSVVPSGWSSAIQALQKYYLYSGDARYNNLLDYSFKNITPLISNYPTAYPNWIEVILNNEKLQDYVIILQHSKDLENAIQMESFLNKWVDHKTLFLTIPPSYKEFEKIDFLIGKKTKNNLSTVYVCHEGSCSLPITNMKELKKQLAILDN